MTTSVRRGRDGVGGRVLRLEHLEGRQLLSAGAESMALAGIVPSGPEDYLFDVVAKAAPDEWYNGIGQPYVPITQAQPAGAIAKVNQAYVWSMTQSGASLWFGTGANVAAMGHSSSGAAPAENAISVTEGAQSQYPIRPEFMRDYIGDWRPAEIWRYDTITGQSTNVTPNDSRIAQTLGLRSAGSTDDVVILAGPAITFLGINMFAFDARSGAYLGSQHFADWGDIRSWVRYQDQLYTGVLRTYSETGEGAVLRWRGTRANPFSFTEVGALDLEAANLAVHDGRLYVSTWPLWVGTLMGMAGYRSPALPGLWMSPELGTGGLTAADAGAWQKVWQIDEYDPDPAVRKSMAGGALCSFDGYLYWGTMQVTGTGVMVLQEEYPNDVLSGQAFSATFRPAAFFRGRHFESPAGREVELLYGDQYLWTYTPAGANPATQPGRFSLAPNAMHTAATFGPAGFGTGTNFYTWSAAVHDNALYVGTIDYSPSRYPNEYVAAGGDVESLLSVVGATLGADVVVFPPGNSQPHKATEFGAGNPLNYGIRTMVSTGQGLFLGSASASNLLTDPASPLKAGGWELIKVSISDTPRAFLDKNRVAENSPAGTPIGILRANLSGSVALSLVDDAGGRFQLVGDQLQVARGDLLDYESAAVWPIVVRVENGSTFEQTLLVTLTNVNEAPTAILLDNASVPAGIGPGATVGFLTALDPDGDTAITFALLDDAGGRFEVVGRTLRVAQSELLVPGTTAQVTVRAADSAGLASEATFSVRVTDLADASRVGLYDPAASTFYLRNSHTSGPADFSFGYGAPGAGWIPLTGDWNGDGRATPGFFDPAQFVFYLRNDNSAGFADYTFAYGDPTQPWIPLVGDWDGDGADGVGFFDPAASVFYLRNSLTTGMADRTFGFGSPGQLWTPLVGDWNGDGTDGIGLYDAQNSVFYLRNALGTGFAEHAFVFGAPASGRTPLVGDWDASGTDTVGFYDPATSVFELRNDNSAGDAHHRLAFGIPAAGWLPLAGNWGPADGPPKSLEPRAVDQVALEPLLAELDGPLGGESRLE